MVQRPREQLRIGALPEEAATSMPVAYSAHGQGVYRFAEERRAKRDATLSANEGERASGGRSAGTLDANVRETPANSIPPTIISW